MLSSLIIAFIAVVIIFFLCKQASVSVWLISYTLLSLLMLTYHEFSIIGRLGLAFIFLLLVIATIKPVRRQLLSNYILSFLHKKLPVMSNTEREALQAGTVSWEADLFTGRPDFNKLRQLPLVTLSAAEQAFINGPLVVLCRMLDDWDITHNRVDLPPEVWQFIKEKGFFGMIIPESYGGLGFSATAQTIILSTLYGRSITAATTVSVPNALGPAELLLKYGTVKQKDYYLPRLADGRDIPCFALTAPNAGSDAAAITDKGVICQQQVNGIDVLGIRLTWNKRYITLCPVATVIGLAFRLYDPDNLLGKGCDLGISCALIPAATPGVIRGRRHFPLNTGFLNGPTQGTDVFVAIDCLIGGITMAGAGWRMLMECLSAGRAISLPSSAMGGTQLAALASGAYARIRKQFNQAIGYFEGIEEPLARIAGNTYLIDAGLTMTAAAIDNGARPSVAGAILKYHTTERARKVAIDAMDIHGGRGICLGPNNYLARGYQNAPISITVEGANILTRSLIIFGQGVIRCHPYVYQTLESVKHGDLKAFDCTLWSHLGFMLANVTKSMLFNLTNGYFLPVPRSKVARFYQHIYRYSANFAWIADFSLIMLGGELKRREKISARLGDMLSHLYLASAVVRRFYHDGEPDEDLPVVQWCCEQLLYECEQAQVTLMANFPNRLAALILKVTLNPFGLRRRLPQDKLAKKLARLMLAPNKTRSRLTRTVFLDISTPVGRLEHALAIICAVDTVEKKFAQAIKTAKITFMNFSEQIIHVQTQGLIDAKEAKLLQQAEKARQEIIAVDDFDDAALRRC